jgi:hypothetical protein
MGGDVTFTTRQLYGFDKSFTVTNANPRLLPSIEKAASEGFRIFASQIRKTGL